MFPQGLLVGYGGGRVCLVRNEYRKPEPLDEAKVRRWLADLNHETFAVRDEASRRLVALGQAALPWLDQAPCKDEVEVASAISWIKEYLVDSLVPRVVVAKPADLEDGIKLLAAAPDGTRWAARVGADGDAVAREVAFGVISEEGLAISQRVEGPAPALRMVFGPDSRTLFVVLANGGIGVYELKR